MIKKILLGVGALFLLLVAFMAYRITTGSKLSPSGTAALSQGGLDVKVDYCRPSKKGRLLFGEKAAGALVPYGQYWRLGANGSTNITFASNVSFAGKPVSAGTYRMYAIPAAGAWKVVLNSEPTRFGARGPDHDKDVLTVEVPVEASPTSVEQFTISFSGEPPATKLDLAWDTTLVRVPLRAN